MAVLNGADRVHTTDVPVDISPAAKPHHISLVSLYPPRWLSISMKIPPPSAPWPRYLAKDSRPSSILQSHRKAHAGLQSRVRFPGGARPSQRSAARSSSRDMLKACETPNPIWATYRISTSTARACMISHSSPTHGTHTAHYRRAPYILWVVRSRRAIALALPMPSP